MKKNYFFGKYYKFISDNNYTFAVILSENHDGYMAQLITPEASYTVNNPHDIMLIGQRMHFNVKQDDLTITGDISFNKLHPLKKKVMGPFSIFKMQCRHDIYSMYHYVDGEVTINGKKHVFNNARGYIEGDSGSSFPTHYLWYNSLLDRQTVTLAIATIPFGLINFTGLLCFIKVKGKEYRFATYNGAKIISKEKDRIEIKKGKYRFIVDITFKEGHDLKAPVEGNMTRIIKENIIVPTSYKLYKKDNLILEATDDLSSYEYVY